MCPNCITQGTWVWLGPGVLCLAFFGLAAYAFMKAKNSGELKGDEEEAKYSVFDD